MKHIQESIRKEKNADPVEWQLYKLEFNADLLIHDHFDKPDRFDNWLDRIESKQDQKAFDDLVKYLFIFDDNFGTITGSIFTNELWDMMDEMSGENYIYGVSYPGASSPSEMKRIFFNSHARLFILDNNKFKSK